jgi:asparagine synthase (glutamine-hydrolysing)
MCGIFAYLDLENNRVDRETVERMSHSLEHRGPDDCGYAFFGIMGEERVVESRCPIDQNALPNFNGLLAFGHRRLSIIDLSGAGHQPMCNESRRIWIIYNGEIYNYKELAEELRGKGHLFRSRTDTEVILHAYEEWGIECLPRFNGMWAFALWDMDRKRLFCARDRFGIKPSYYFFNNKQFIFASEIKAILQERRIERSPRHQRVYDYLAYGYSDHTHETFFKDIYQLRGAHYSILEIDGENDLKLSVHPYWNLKLKEGGTKDDLKERFFELLEDSIRLHMRSDVPIGTCLSGGIDSSSIVCLARRFLSTNVHKTFSSCFEDKKYDERDFICKVVGSTNVEPHYVFPKPDDLFEEIEDIIWYQDEPFGSTSIYAQWSVFRLAKQNHVKVILDGQGADELLGGYHPFFGYYLGELMRTFQINKVIKEYHRIRVLHQYSHYWLISHIILSMIPWRWNNQIVSWKEGWVKSDNCSINGFTLEQKCENIFFERIYHSLMDIILPRLLHYEDRNAMAHSIEARVPFLDYRLVEFVFSLPINQFISNGVTKVVLRGAMKGILPEVIRRRIDKMGFVTPEDIWFKTVLKGPVQGIIGSRSFAERGYFDMKKVKEAYNEHCEGKRNIGSTIWRWVNLELWFRTFIDKGIMAENR